MQLTYYAFKNSHIHENSLDISAGCVMQQLLADHVF